MNCRYISILCAAILLVMNSCRKSIVDTEGETEDPVAEVVGLLTSNPAFPLEDAEVTILFDSKKGNEALKSEAGEIYAHLGVLTDKSQSPSDWKYVKTAWEENTSASRMESVSAGVYQLRLSPRAFFGVPAGERITHIAMVFRNADGSVVGRNIDESDIYLPLYEKGKLAVQFIAPEMQPMHQPQPLAQRWAVGQTVQFGASSSLSSDLSISVNGEQIKSVQSNNITVDYTFPSSGNYSFKVTATKDGQSAGQEFSIFVSGEAEVADLPAGIERDGVTLLNDGRSAVFVLTAPEKGFVHIVGEFNDWQVTAEGTMKKTPDGQKWWTQIDGLEQNKQYAYQYVVDGNLRIADPYTELVLDPDHDRFIPTGTFSNLKSYPTGKTTGIVSVLNTKPHEYAWKNPNFVRPHKHDLVIYELLLRDFLDANNYQTLRDTLDYLSNLGVNALQLLPVNEFEGNSSWGYNPSFYFAADKYYGTKNHLKELIDECHGRGIAVILDVIFNHSFGQSPMVQLYFQNGNPTSNSPWFNTNPTHPYNVGYDFNHESILTRSFTKDVVRFWAEEYQVDGFRFDLSKGFTQKNSGTSESGVGAWSAYDASRVAIWKDYNSFLRNIDQDMYVILEHFAEDREEQELAKEGMMMWNNVNYAFNEATMGWLDNSNFDRVFHTKHGFDQPNLISYMESHDEERIMFKNLQYGNDSQSTHNVKNLATALKRVELAAAFLFAAPGPKMIWQFGELGYDTSIEENGRTGEKPMLWNYNTGARRQLYAAFSRFIRFKTKNDIFRNGEPQFDVAGAIKHILLTKGEQQVLVVGNFDVVAKDLSVSSAMAGQWYDNLTNATLEWSSGNSLTLLPGQYYILSKHKLK